MDPAPGGNRKPPTHPPRTAVGLGGADGNDRRAIKVEAVRLAEELDKISNLILDKMKAHPEREPEYRELFHDSLQLMKNALRIASNC